MKNYVSGVNPQMLYWAREKAGYSLDDVARSFGKNVDEIEEWESGKAAPTYVQLEKLAYSLYKRPIAIFFFPEPPKESDPKQSFRTLPETELNNLHPDTRYAIRIAQVMHISLLELNDGKNPSKRKIFEDIQITSVSDFSYLASQVRNYLGIDIHTQIKWKSNEEALEFWRNVIQDCGIYVFKRSFKQEDISGFCLVSDQFPLIYLNNSTSVSRQIFTILHELAHILLNVNGITKQSDSYISALVGNEKAIEIFCNKLSAEILVPSVDFDAKLNSWESIDDQIQKLSKHYKVSREVVMRKLLDRGIIDQVYYDNKVNELLKEYKTAKSKKSDGGSYYATQATYLGSKYLELAFGNYYQGKCTIEQLASYLHVKVQNIPGLEPFVFRGAI